LQLEVLVREAEGSKPRVGVFLCTCSYECQGQVVAPVCEIIRVKFTVTYLPPATASSNTLFADSCTLLNNWGKAEVFQASSMSDLEPHLRDGHLKLGATFKILL
jgi:hypothetical protein